LLGLIASIDALEHGRARKQYGGRALCRTHARNRPRSSARRTGSAPNPRTSPQSRHRLFECVKFCRSRRDLTSRRTSAGVVMLGCVQCGGLWCATRSRFAAACTTVDRIRSRERRRRLAYSGPLPARLAAAFTPAEVAVLRIVADEHRDRGGCARSIDEIAARAGVCRRTVQNALRHAEHLGLVSIMERRREGARNLPNVVRVVSREWLVWLKHHTKAREQQVTGCKAVHPTENKSFSRDSAGNEGKATASATRRHYDRGPNRARCQGAV
jgi:hypothetical protein